MSIEIIESGLTFGPFESCECFHIEKSSLYSKIRDGVKMVEFVLYRKNNKNKPTLWLVEAKSSSPRSGEEVGFSEYIQEISDKMNNALSLMFATLLKRHTDGEGEVLNSLGSVDLATCEVRFVLVIDKHEKEWLPPIQDALKKSLKATIATWKLGPYSVVILNEELAAARKLIRME